MNPIPYIFSLALLVAGGCLFFLQKKRTCEQHKIRLLRERVQAALEDTGTKKTPPLFATSLTQAAMSTRLQKPRIRLQSGTKSGPPEKYTFFSNLVAKGMNAEEIAEVLDISTTEASQLVQLCGLTGCRNSADSKQGLSV